MSQNGGITLHQCILAGAFSVDRHKASHEYQLPPTDRCPDEDRQKWVEYLRYYVGGQQRTWVRWLHMDEYCYNKTHHMSIRMSPFRALYGYDAPTFVDTVFRDSKVPLGKDWVEKSQRILRAVNENLQAAQNQQKIYANRQRIKRNFEVGDLVFLRLQPYQQSSLKRSGAEKLKSRFYASYRVIRRVGEVAYELELSEGSKIHNVFHVSCLKGSGTIDQHFKGAATFR
jgi:hypothetical protein